MTMSQLAPEPPTCGLKMFNAALDMELEFGVKISDVTYQGVHGTSATAIAVKFDCSSKYPCSG
ncbi:hypothetical protein Patl1_26953 [Pistacia atlantica]|uniref:Uncharacterized protein n=1 Tax=Pistacia atlantica TaxID=434234 RepID=A0ACC1B4X3_9ROSI|nr:hypothetical protein Patl1_26953 [Pistacia atlantica]